jgi:tRNA modification GTPase
MTTDTIAACATPPGRGGVGIIRVSGPACRAIAREVIGDLPPARKAAHRVFSDRKGESIDDGLALFFPGPNSFTGEDVLELQGHGGPVVMDMLLNAVLEAGARPARPGEFSERAFLNDKLDLAQAEAIADLIDSSTQQAARSALRSLQGGFSERINVLAEKMVELRVYVEAALDFPDEEIDFLADEGVQRRLQDIETGLDQIFSEAKQGSLLREGMNLVLAGRPNAGKSSLLNALSGREAAIVTHIPGTTRDVLKESIHIDGMPLHITDTAGLRESDDPVEQEGIRRAWQAIEQADLMLMLIDDTRGKDVEELTILERLPPGLRVIEVYNKIDLSGRPAGRHGDEMGISAHTGAGISDLKTALKEHMGFHSVEEGQFLARRRHLHALQHAQEHIVAAREQLEVFHAGELMAEELRLAHDNLGEITGKVTADDLLGQIFSSFCIGK